MTLSSERVITANTQVDVTDWDIFATVAFGSMVPSGSWTVQGDSEEVTKTLYNCMYSVNLIGNNSILMAQRLLTSLRSTAVTNELKALKVGILSLSAIRPLPIGLDGGFEERAQFDIFLSQETVIKTPLQSVTNVDFNLIAEQ